MIQVLGIFGFLSFGWADVLDILMVAVIIYLLFRSLRGDSTVLNIVLVLTMAGLSYSKSYKHVFICSVLMTMAATLIVIAGISIFA